MKLEEEKVSDAQILDEWKESKVLQPFSVDEIEKKREEEPNAVKKWKKEYKKWKQSVKKASNGSLYSDGDPPFPGSNVSVSEMAQYLANGEYYQKPYETEKLLELIELSGSLKDNLKAFSRNTVGLDIDYEPYQGKPLHELSKDEVEDYHEQGRELLQWLNSKAPFGRRFNSIARQHMEGKKGLGDGYLEVIRDVKGRIVKLNYISAVYIFVRKGGGYIWIKNGKKKYYKEFGNLDVMNVWTGAAEPKPELKDRATELLPFTEFNDLSSHYGVPNWSANIPGVVGNRYAEERNVNFFHNDAPQPLYSKVLTSTGWKTMGTVEIGDKVIGQDGKSYSVTDVKPQGQKDVYKVTFMDGTSTECTLGHLWTVTNNYDRQRGVTRTVTLAELIEDGFFYESGPAKWAVALPEPVEFEQEEELPIHPYILGLLLGDGYLDGKGSHAQLSTCSKDTLETIEEITPLLPSNTTLKRRDSLRAEDGSLHWTKRVELKSKLDETACCSELSFAKKDKTVYRNEIITALKKLGLLDKKARTKFIPECYLKASVEDRISLLQGIIDSDGSIDNHNHGYSTVRMITTSSQLAQDMTELVGSLGGVATSCPVKDRADQNSVIVRQLPKWIVPARLKRKAEIYNPSTALRWRTMTGAEKVGKTETQCIQTSAKDSLYVTDNYIVTHNTPRMIIIVSGGRVDEASRNEAKKFFRYGKGREHYGRTMIFTVSGKNSLHGNNKVPEVKIEPLGVGKTDDASFLKYQEANKANIRQAFQQALTFLGQAGDTNRASAYTLRDQTVTNNYLPEAKEHAYLVNEALLPEFKKEKKYNKLLVQMKYVLPRTMSEKDFLTHKLDEFRAGALTVNDYRVSIGLDKIDKWWAELSVKILVPAIQMAELAPDVVDTLTDYDEGAGGSVPDKPEEEISNSLRSLVAIRRAIHNILTKDVDSIHKRHRDIFEKLMKQEREEEAKQDKERESSAEED